MTQFVSGASVVNMTALTLIDLFDGDVSQFSANTLVIDVGGNAFDTVIGNGFTDFDADGVPAEGTITGIRQEADGDLNFLMSNFAITVENFLARAATGNNNALLATLFRGNDTIFGSSLNDILTGLDGNDIVYGNGGNDQLRGGDGSDVLNGGGGNDRLTGADGSDTLRGGGGNDRLDGGDTGFDLDFASYFSASGGVTVSLAIVGPQAIGGGQGNDTLVEMEGIEGSKFNDTITGNADNFNVLLGRGGNDTIDGGGGTDYVSYTLATSGVTVDLSIAGPQAIGGGEGSDTLVNIAAILGSEFNDALTGNNDNNFFEGRGGNDSYDGGGGLDTVSHTTVTGGLTIDLTDTGAQNIGAGQGLETFASIEGLIGGNFDDEFTGNGAANTFDGGGGNDALSSGTGDDILNGNGGNDTLNGGAGSDTMSGGSGNDVYTVNSSGDITSEGVNAGTDTVRSTVSFTLRANFERLVLTGATSTSGTGNALENVITGNDANNILDGAEGADTLQGRDGSDNYIVDNVGDEVIEGASAGNDTVQSTVAFTLGDNVENLTLLGNAAIDGTGNALNNVMNGNAQANTLSGLDGLDTIDGGDGNDTLRGQADNDSLVGGVGNDSLLGGDGDDTISGGTGNDDIRGGDGNDNLVGGGGSDSFVFDTALGAGNVDDIAGFAVAADSIHLDNTIFTAVGAEGALAAGAFVIGSAAADAGDRIIYDSTTGEVFYDEDGTGVAAAVLFATLPTGLALDASNFIVV